jgi:voltage-gated potassium channel Kch
LRAGRGRWRLRRTLLTLGLGRLLLALGRTLLLKKSLLFL